MIHHPDDEEKAARQVAGTEPTKQRRRRCATIADIRAALRRIEEREGAGGSGDG
jgi:hypothetical protein